MKRFMWAFILSLLVMCTFTTAFATDGGMSLDDLISGETTSQADSNDGQKDNSNGTGDSSFINGLNEAADLTEPVEGVDGVTSVIRSIAAWVVQVLCYGITVLLVVRVLLDLAYIGLPFCRGFLGNGFQGNAQAGAGGVPNSAFGNTGMGPGIGMGPGMGMGGYRSPYMNNAGMGMSMSNANANQSGSVLGRIQWVSNAALNAVAGESTVGPNGKSVSPFKLYCKDMIVIMVLMPILITLAVTGVLTNLGFLIADLIVSGISSLDISSFGG